MNSKKTSLYFFSIQILFLFDIYIYIYIYILLQQFMVVTISLGWLVVDQMQYNLVSAQYL